MSVWKKLCGVINDPAGVAKGIDFSSGRQLMCTGRRLSLVRNNLSDLAHCKYQYCHKRMQKISETQQR